MNEKIRYEDRKKRKYKKSIKEKKKRRYENRNKNIIAKTPKLHQKKKERHIKHNRTDYTTAKQSYWISTWRR